jgi:hypothetical protein
MDWLFAAALFGVAFFSGIMFGMALAHGVAEQKLRELQDWVQQLKQRWWAAFWHMVRRAEAMEADDRGDYWKHDRKPPWQRD